MSSVFNAINRGKLKTKIAFWAVMIVVIVQVFNSAILFSTKKDEITKDIYYNAENFSRLTTAKVVEYYEKYNDSGYFKFYDLVDELLTQNKEISAIYLIKTDGKVLFGPDDLTLRRPPGVIQQKIPISVGKRLFLAELTVETIEHNGKPYMEILSPYVEEWGKHTYSVLYRFNFDTMDNRLAFMRKQFILIGTACVAIGILLAIFLSSRITRGISELLQAVREISKGDWGRKVNTKSSDEIGELSEAFDSMRKDLKSTLDELTDTQKELKNLNQSLEKKVSDRTLELAQKNKELELLSITDRLTGLYNRRYLDQQLTGELSRSKRTGQSFGIVLMDVDHFKMINDTYGHQEGDRVLQEVGTILHKWTRRTDIVSRWGGEEFMIVCPDTDQTGVLKLAEELRKAMELYDFSISNGITASFGATSLYPDDTVEMMVARADTALYLAKEKGRNRVEQHMPLQKKYG